MATKKVLHTQLVRSVSFREKSTDKSSRKPFLKLNQGETMDPASQRISQSYDDILADHGLDIEDTFDELLPLAPSVHRTSGKESLANYDVMETVVCRERSWSCNDGSDTIVSPKPIQYTDGSSRKIARSRSMRQLRSNACPRAYSRVNGDNEVGSTSARRMDTHLSLGHTHTEPGTDASNGNRPKSSVSHNRCIALYNRARTPHFCDAHKKIETDLKKPSAWSFGKHRGAKQMSPRQVDDERKNHKKNLKCDSIHSSLSKLSLASSNSSDFGSEDKKVQCTALSENGARDTSTFTDNKAELFEGSLVATPDRQHDSSNDNGTKKPSSLPRPVRSASFRLTRTRSAPVTTPLIPNGAMKHSNSALEERLSDMTSYLSSASDPVVSSSSSSTLSVDGSICRDVSRGSSELAVPDDNDGYPDPIPPTTRKSHIFNPRDFTQIDQKALQAPPHLSDDTEGLLGYLLDGLDTDIAKIRAIYRWLTSQHLSFEGRPRDVTPDSPLDLLYRIQEGRCTYAELLSVLCRKADIPCVIIHGVAKGVAYDVGDKISNKRMKNSWNAVYVNNAWRLIHPYWAGQIARGYHSGRWAVVECGDFHLEDGVDSRQMIAHTVNDFYFLTDPDEFITKCFPDDPSWQLLSKPINKTEFEELAFRQPAFYDLKLHIKSHSHCVLHTDNGTVEIIIEMPPDKIKRYKFKYKLFMNRDREAEGEYELGLLDKYLLHYIRDNLAVFEIRFPIRGVFKLELHCNDSKRPLPSDWVCDYKIVCTRPMRDCQSLPVAPAIGWGPGHDLEASGLESLTHKNAIVNLDKEFITFIRFALPKDSELKLEAELLKNNQSREEMNSHVTIEHDGEHAVVQVTPPNEGEYALQLFVVKENEDGQQWRRNVCNYLMHRTQIVEDPALADIRNQLVGATEQGDVETLSLWIERFEEKSMEDRGDLTLARKQQALAKLNRDIREAIDRKDLDMLERTMQSLSDTSVKSRLGHLAHEAEAMRSRLRRLKRLQHQVLALDQKTISELRSYPKPPPPVHGVMAATFLLLGNREPEVKKWSKIQGLISKKGRLSLKRRVAEFRIDDVDPVLRKRVQVILSKYDMESVQIASVGAATFYEWAHSMTGDLD